MMIVSMVGKLVDLMKGMFDGNSDDDYRQDCGKI
jgi:hypothetical protein